ncbi:futalosine hydrolase [Niabella yanshanensis]|uniref:Futalosine hydrolase n=1 Tax=Niabella yanshanensis TaxID=577386 RepID=A0ABZ0WDM8_9BACT|nr:futalosine hydrolase [Niabella yanshanensis]WQD40787.1 futalosine hydrolase [Niabella yanshanensis]
MWDSKRILIVAATKMEIASSLPVLKKWHIPVAITGVGAAPSVYHMVKAIVQYQPSVMIQAGIAGCFDRKYLLGKVVAVTEERFADLGVEEHQQWKSVFDMGFIAPGQKPFKEGRLKNPHKKLQGIAGIEAVAGVTVNEVTTNKNRIRLLKTQGAVVESMEGAALHYVALMEKIPFLQIRSLSNYVGERDKSKWNFKDAIGNLNQELVRIVQQMISNSPL